MSPTINEYSARIGVERAEQSAQRVVKTDDKNRGSNRLQILRQKTHPQLFACANDKYGDKQNDEIAFEPEESSEGFQRRHVGVLSDSFALFKSPRGTKMDGEKSELVAKVPQVTFLFWVVKILATTLGETAGDAVTMSWLGETTPEAKGTGYLVGTGIFGVIFMVAVLVQIRAKKFHPFLYWLTIAATTTLGTTLADYC